MRNAIAGLFGGLLVALLIIHDSQKDLSRLRTERETTKITTDSVISSYRLREDSLLGEIGELEGKLKQIER